jgi:hypothetical protein
MQFAMRLIKEYQQLTRLCSAPKHAAPDAFARGRSLRIAEESFDFAQGNFRRLRRNTV